MEVVGGSDTGKSKSAQGGGGSISEAFFRASSTVWKALDLALSKLSAEKCRGLFGNASSPDPGDVLKGLLYGSSQYGAVTMNDIPDKPGEATSAITSVSGSKPVDIGFGATQLVPATVLITINDLAGDFVSGDVKESAATLLHELGHAYYYLVALGGSKITPDGNDVKKSQDNQARIKENCF